MTFLFAEYQFAGFETVVMKMITMHVYILAVRQSTSNSRFFTLTLKGAIGGQFELQGH